MGSSVLLDLPGENLMNEESRRRVRAPKLILVLAVTIVGVALAAREGRSSSQDTGQPPPVYHVFFHSPGPQWKPGVSFREQPGIEEHVAYMHGLLERGLMVMGGPFLDDSGGMMVSRIPTLEEARRVASEDPGVESGLLRVEVRAWLVPMASVPLPGDKEH